MSAQESYIRCHNYDEQSLHSMYLHTIHSSFINNTHPRWSLVACLHFYNCFFSSFFIFILPCKKKDKVVWFSTAGALDKQHSAHFYFNWIVFAVFICGGFITPPSPCINLYCNCMWRWSGSGCAGLLAQCLHQTVHNNPVASSSGDIESARSDDDFKS